MGFVRDKDSTGTTCYVCSFWTLTGSTGGTTGAAAYLTDSGAISITAGTFSKIIGVYDSTTGGQLHAHPGDLSQSVGAGSPSGIGTGADSGTSSLASRLDHKHKITTPTVVITTGESSYTTLSGDEVVLGDTDSGAVTILLMAGIAGTTYRIVNAGTAANNVTVTPNGAENLIGANSNFTLLDGEDLLITYNATKGWY